MTNKEIAKWLSDFHNDLENRTNKNTSYNERAFGAYA